MFSHELKYALFSCVAPLNTCWTLNRGVEKQVLHVNLQAASNSFFLFSGNKKNEKKIK